MGKKGSWFSAIKRAFSPHSKEKIENGSEKKNRKEKKGFGKLKHGETNSFIPLFREPSSIEKIFGDFEREQQGINFRPRTPDEQPKTPPFVAPRFEREHQGVNLRPRTPDEQPKTPPFVAPRFEREHQGVNLRPHTPDEQPKTSPFVAPRVTSPRAPSPRAPSPRASSPRAVPPRTASPTPRAPSPRAPSPRVIHHNKEISYRPEPTLKNQHASATRIQAAYRGYVARRSFRALKGLVRLQGVVRGQNVKRQTLNAMKYMQLLVRVQSQIQSRRIQMLENQARDQVKYNNDKEVESTFGKWTLSQSEIGDNDEWDDSLLTKEEVEARSQKKVEAIVKRERAMAYSYSHQLWKTTPKASQTPIADTGAAAFPWWWNWLERQLPTRNLPAETNALKNIQLTPPRPHSELKPSPPPQSINQRKHLALDSNLHTPKSVESTKNITTLKQVRTPPLASLSSTPQANSSGLSKYRRRTPAGGDGSPFDFPLKDDDSLTSCPPFSVPNYMASTASAKAKARASSNPRERYMGTPSSESKRRVSFPLSQGLGSFKWNKPSFFSNKDSSSQRSLHKNQSLQSMGDLSIDSTVSMPAGVGRRPFNRFV